MTPESPLLQLATPLTGAAPDWPRIDSKASARAAAKLASELASGGVILTSDGMDVSTVATRDLLGLLAQDLDPVSGLPRSGPLRDWLDAHLAEGREVSVVFLDLDAFGEVNRTHGHAEGDAALARVARVLLSYAGDRDFVARFGGDEFAIGSLRNRQEAEMLAARLTQTLAKESLPACAGVSGGRRDTPRSDVSFGSMVEELLRLASLSCMEQKRNRPRGA